MRRDLDRRAGRLDREASMPASGRPVAGPLPTAGRLSDVRPEPHYRIVGGSLLVTEPLAIGVDGLPADAASAVNRFDPMVGLHRWWSFRYRSTSEGVTHQSRPFLVALSFPLFAWTRSVS